MKEQNSGDTTPTAVCIAGPPAQTVQECAAIVAAELHYWRRAGDLKDPMLEIASTGALANVLCAINGFRAPWHPAPIAQQVIKQEAADADMLLHSILRNDLCVLLGIPVPERTREGNNKIGDGVAALKSRDMNYTTLRAEFHCKDHPDVNPLTMWGCPDCLHELKRECGQIRAVLGEICRLFPYGPHFTPEQNRALASLTAAAL